jgi:hypothetical protein
MFVLFVCVSSFCVPYVASFSGLSIFLIVRSVFSDAYSPPFSIEIIVPNQESKQSGIVVLEVL